jgi:hypothetical protein
MAIKGKGRTRGRKVVAAPPRRQLVVRKPPIWRRPWVLAVVGLIVLGGILAGILTAVGNRAKEARTDRETLAVQRFLDRVRAEFPDETQNVPPDLVVIFPSVSQALPQIGNELSPAEARRKGGEVAEAAAAAAEGIQAIPVDDVVPAEFAGHRATFADAQFMMSQALRIYERIGALMETAGQVSGRERTALVEQAQELTTQAGALFDRGYAKIVRIANRLRISTAVTPRSSPTPSPNEASPSPSPSPSG